jgi:5-methylcytosine-specific restriction enzyme A
MQGAGVRGDQASRRTPLRHPTDRLQRCKGNCENPQCDGHPKERATAGKPISQVDHVQDLAKGGPDVPWNMIVLCPNCHALKTYGVNREKLRRLLSAAAKQLHANAFL